MEACLPLHDTEFQKDPKMIQAKASVAVPPPPYTITSPKLGEDRAAMDSLLYQKMLSLESMVSNIHESVVDQGSYLDVSVQLKEINETMNRFQQEASVRLRKKLTASLHSRPGSFYSQMSCDSEATLDLVDSPDVADLEETPAEDPQGAEENVRYQRVCSLLENLITDASSVLQDSPELNPMSLNPPEEDELAQFKNEALRKSEEVGVKLLCEIKQGDSAAVHEIPVRSILPLLNNEVDAERLSLMPSRQNSQTDTRLMNENIQRALLVSANSTQRTILSLLYWTFIFTIGSVLFDSALCNMAGFQVMSILNSASGGSGQRRRSNTIDGPQPPTFTPPTNAPPPNLARRKSL